jgi:hypothetical protein
MKVVKSTEVSRKWPSDVPIAIAYGAIMDKCQVQLDQNANKSKSPEAASKMRKYIQKYK